MNDSDFDWGFFFILKAIFAVVVTAISKAILSYYKNINKEILNMSLSKEDKIKLVAVINESANKVTKEIQATLERFLHEIKREIGHQDKNANTNYQAIMNNITSAMANIIKDVNKHIDTKFSTRGF